MKDIRITKREYVENTMNKSPMISVIVPMYNVEKYIRQCVESIETQTIKDLEIILIDDGSSDGSYEVASQLAEEYSNIILIKKENGGQGSARNVGLNKATGKYISFIDSDDFIDEKMYEYLLAMAEESGLDIAEGCFQDVFPSKNEVGKIYFRRIEDKRVYKGIDFYNLRPSLSPCNKIYRKSFLDEINYRCTEGHYAEDVYDTTYAIINAEKAAHINEVVYFYRRDNPGSTRNNKKIDRRIKLGIDKLYIAKKMNTLKNEKQVSGVIEEYIVRNVVGVVMNPLYFKSSEYRKVIKVQFKEYGGMQLIKENISPNVIYAMIALGIKKILKRGT